MLFWLYFESLPLINICRFLIYTGMIVGLVAAFQIIILKHLKFASVRYEQDNSQISEDTCNYF